MPSDRSPPDPLASDPGQQAKPARAPIGELLVQSKVLTREQLDQALGVPRDPGRKLGELLIERGWVTEAQLTQTLSLQLSVPWVSLYHIDFSRQLLNRVSRELADRHCLIPIFVRHVKGHGETLYVAMDDPTNEAALAEVAAQAGLPARPMIASATDIRSAIRVYYGEVASPDVVEVTVPAAVRPEPLPTTTREGRPREAPAPPPAPPSPPPVPVAEPALAPVSAPASSVPSTQPDATPLVARAATPSQPPARPSQPVRPSPPPVARPRTVPPSEAEPRTTRGSFLPPPSSAPEGGAARRRPGKMVSLTLLDGTTIALPARPKGKAAANFASQEGLTARDFISALRAASHGADASEILGEKPQWEPVVAALLSILLRKGLIADWELVEELRKI